MRDKEISVKPWRHIISLLIIIVVLGAGFFLARALLMPESFGRYGHYRGDNVKEQMSVPLVHMESAFCEDCHETQYGDWLANKHLTVNCEVCHGHWEIHNGNLKTMKVVKSDDACMICHQRLTGRPEDFPQVVSLVQHIEDKEEPAEGAEVCLSCHDPHKPLL